MRQIVKAAIVICLSIATGLAAVQTVAAASAQREPKGAAYLIDPEISDINLSSLPQSASDVVVAKVHLVGEIHWAGRPETPAISGSDVFFTSIRILDVRSGSAVVGSKHLVWFGKVDRDVETVAPCSPNEMSRDYLAVIFLDKNDNKRRLMGFPLEHFDHAREQAHQLECLTPQEEVERKR